MCKFQDARYLDSTKPLWEFWLRYHRHTPYCLEVPGAKFEYE